MKHIFLFAILTVISIGSYAAPYDPVFRRLNIFGSASQDSNMSQCASVGAIFIDPSPLPSSPPLANCIELGSGIVISSGLLTADMTVVASKSTVDSVEADVSTLLGIVASLESAVATLQSTVATLTSDLNALSAEVDGKFDIPMGTDMECVRGDGSVGACP